MRKNGVNKEIREIGGGLCAPKGFRAAFARKDGVEGTLVVCDGRYPFSVLPPRVSFLTADAAESSSSKDGRIKALFLEKGVANLCQKEGDSLAKRVRKTVAAQLACAEKDALVFSVGEISGKYSLETVTELSTTLATALSSETALENGFSFEFDLGDFPVRIGGVLSRRARLSSGFPEFTFIVTTDIRISGEMLEKAFHSAYRDTFALSPRADSPFDCAVMISSLAAENYEISKADGEYEKFLDALTRVFAWLAEKYAIGEGERLFELSVSGGRSKQSTRAAVRALAKSVSVRTGAFETPELADVIAALASLEAAVGIKRARIRVLSEYGELILVEDGVALAHNAEYFARIVSAEKIFLSVELFEGHYASVTWVRA